MSGPLTGLKVVEFSGIGPGPFCGMLLADMGADVICIDRKSSENAPAISVLSRGKRSISLNLKDPADVKTALRLVKRSDVLLEGFRPGVMERLGLGPDVCLKTNPALIYGRMTGWGQEGPLAQAAGHDINYISLTGALAAIGPKDGPPSIPLNLVGDFGGGALYLAMGICAALFERSRSGKGQVIDAAMVDGATSLAGSFLARALEGKWNSERASNQIDGGAPYYNVYETADGEYISIGSIEPQFYAMLKDKLELDGPLWEQQMNQDNWPLMSDELRKVFRRRTRSEWCDLMEGTDICFAPVLSFSEITSHPHMKAREVIVTVDDTPQSNAAPRFSRTPSKIGRTPERTGMHTEEILKELEGEAVG
jgi:alpha-methylacyl-CoA racemase|tara:strand:- start:4986 stop:6083 length:1098 start_codon:yes stop_codon:yes gene_type:complete